MLAPIRSIFTAIALSLVATGTASANQCAAIKAEAQPSLLAAWQSSGQYKQWGTRGGKGMNARDAQYKAYMEAFWKQMDDLAAKKTPATVGDFLDMLETAFKVTDLKLAKKLPKGYSASLNVYRHETGYNGKKPVNINFKLADLSEQSLKSDKGLAKMLMDDGAYAGVKITIQFMGPVTYVESTIADSLAKMKGISGIDAPASDLYRETTAGAAYTKSDGWNKPNAAALICAP